MEAHATNQSEGTPHRKYWLTCARQTFMKPIRYASCPQELLPNFKQLSCVVCCRKNHDKENMPTNGSHTRHGNKTRYECHVCKVALCDVKRWDGLTCFEIFHAVPKLPRPCIPSEAKPLHIRAPPPSRKRSSDSIEPNERRVTRLTPQLRRRSGRISRRET